MRVHFIPSHCPRVRNPHSESAFDTVYHNITRLCNESFRYSVTGVFNSYLCPRYQVSVVNDVMSSMCQIDCGKSQGSTLGPLLFFVTSMIW